MRLSSLLGIVVLATGCAYPAQTGQVDVSMAYGQQLGPEVYLYAYSPRVYGDWRFAYTQWTPVTIYYFEGRYYSSPVRYARPVVVYSHYNEYFLPPPDRAWIGVDTRIDYRYVPNSKDRRRAKYKGGDRGRGH